MCVGRGEAGKIGGERAELRKIRAMWLAQGVRYYTLNFLSFRFDIVQRYPMRARINRRRFEVIRRGYRERFAVLK